MPPTCSPDDAHGCDCYRQNRARSHMPALPPHHPHALPASTSLDLNRALKADRLHRLFLPQENGSLLSVTVQRPSYLLPGTQAAQQGKVTNKTMRLAGMGWSTRQDLWTNKTAGILLSIPGPPQKTVISCGHSPVFLFQRNSILDGKNKGAKAKPLMPQAF